MRVIVSSIAASLVGPVRSCLHTTIAAKGITLCEHNANALYLLCYNIYYACYNVIYIYIYIISMFVVCTAYNVHRHEVCTLFSVEH